MPKRGEKTGPIASIADNAAVWEYIRLQDANAGWKGKGWSVARWNRAAVEIGGYWKKYQNHKGQRSAHPLYNMVNYRLPEVHPIHGASMGQGLIVSEAIDLLISLKAEQARYPPLTVLGPNSVVVPRVNRNNKWQKELTGSFAKLFKAIDELKHSSAKNNDSAKDDKSNQRSTIILNCLHKKTGLALDNKEVYRSFLAAVQNDETANAVQFVQGSYTAVFRQWAGLSVDMRNLQGYMAPGQAIELFDQYHQEPIVQIINQAVGFVFNFQRKAMIEARKPENLKIFDIVWRDRHSNSVYTNELDSRADEGCPSSCSCYELGFSAFSIFHELHHVGEAGQRRKQKYRHESSNEPVQPNQYNEEQMADQRSFMEKICQLNHRLVTREDERSRRSNSAGMSNTLSLARAGQLAIRQGVQISACSSCPVTGKSITYDNIRAYDAHHATELQNLLIGGYVFVSGKKHELSQLAYKHFSSQQVFLETLFRELIVTRTIDCRTHQSMWHFMLNNREALAEKGFEFEYPFETVKSNGEAILRYTGELSELGLDEGLLARYADENGVIDIQTGLVEMDAKPPAQEEEDTKPPADDTTATATAHAAGADESDDDDDYSDKSDDATAVVTGKNHGQKRAPKKSTTAPLGRKRASCTTAVVTKSSQTNAKKRVSTGKENWNYEWMSRTDKHPYAQHKRR